MVACDYTKISGVDCTENFALVINDVTLRLLLVLIPMFKLDTKMIDIEGAFLRGDLENEIYMKMPEGLNFTEEGFIRKKIRSESCLQFK